MRLVYLWEQPHEPELFENHYRNVHIPLARKIPRMRSYAITDNVTGIRGEAFYRVAEMRWDSMEDFEADFGSPEGRATAADVEVLLQYTTARAVILGDSEELL